MHDTFLEDVYALHQAAFIMPREAQHAAFRQEAVACFGSKRIETVQSMQIVVENESHQSDRLMRLKALMIDAARAHIGLLGVNLIDDIARADDYTTLMLVVGQWHLALRESKRGSTLADTYLQQVRAALNELSGENSMAA